MASEYNYDIFLNEKLIATVGPSSLKQLHISFGVKNEKSTVNAGGVSEDEGKLQYLNWLEESVDFGDSLRISPSVENIVTDPRHTKKLGRSVGDEEVVVCDFCNRSEAEVGQLIRLGDSPQICNACTKRCVGEFQGKR